MTQDLYQFLLSLNLIWFRPDELIIREEPPRTLWENIIPTIVILDQLRQSLARPIVITSSYRSEARNKRIPGSAPLSQHQAFTALDFTVAGVTSEEAAKRLREWRGAWFRLPFHGLTREVVSVDAGRISMTPLETDGDQFRFEGGIGQYSHRNFTHLDTRGHRADWSY